MDCGGMVWEGVEQEAGMVVVEFEVLLYVTD